MSSGSSGKSGRSILGSSSARLLRERRAMIRGSVASPNESGRGRLTPLHHLSCGKDRACNAARPKSGVGPLHQWT